MTHFKLKKTIFASAILVFTITFPSIVFAAQSCRELFNFSPSKPAKVTFEDKKFNSTTNSLRSTLSGKLATVWRSEWKTKLKIQESNQYVLDMVHDFLTPQSADFVLLNLDVKSEGFTRAVHARLSELKSKNEIQPGDDLMVRDEPSPEGVKDQTFTYYTKPVVAAKGEGKHQLRIRTYIRDIKYAEIPVGNSVNGFNELGHVITVSKVSGDLFKIETELAKDMKTTLIKSAHDLDIEYNGVMQFFAPHGKSFKLEVKTALNDEIGSANGQFPLLSGKHMVQKLDVSLSPAQVAKLFAPLIEQSTEGKKIESINRINKLESDIINAKPDLKARTEAVFNIVREAIQINSDYLLIEGATLYSRTAFESKSGYQTTVDRDQSVFQGSMYNNESLKTPTQTMTENHPLVSGEENARHIELKVPVTSIKNALGVKFQDPTRAPAPDNTQNDHLIKKAIRIYSKYVFNGDHSGKFNYLIKNGID